MIDFSKMDRDVLRTLQLPEDADIWYTPTGGARRKIEDVIFKSPATPVVGADLTFDGIGPQFWVHRCDVPQLKKNDIFERGGVRYIVTEVGDDEGYLVPAFCRLE